MDGSINGKSKMRPLNANSHKEVKPRKRKVEYIKKKRSRIKRTEFFTSLWQLFFFNIISAILIFLFISQGSYPINRNEINLKGSKKIKKEEIITSSSISYPKTLLQINPKELKRNILKEIPLRAISINRSFFPPRLEISILEREPVAFASRKKAKTLEKGMVDLSGHWIPLKQAYQDPNEQINLYIEGWSKGQQKNISKILQSRKRLESYLNKIILDPNGEIRLKDQKGHVVIIGADTKSFDKQVEIILHLQNSLPKIFNEESETIIDLRDLLKPKITNQQI